MGSPPNQFRKDANSILERGILSHAATTEAITVVIDAGPSAYLRESAHLKRVGPP